MSHTPKTFTAEQVAKILADHERRIQRLEGREQPTLHETLLDEVEKLKLAAEEGGDK